MRSFLLLLFLWLMTDEDDCQRPFTQTAYRTAKTTITCDYLRNNDDDKYNRNFFCKETPLTCENIVSAMSSKSNGRLTLTQTSRGFSVSISNVAQHDAGVYWCGVESADGNNRLKRIQLEVKEITNFTQSATVGQGFSYYCKCSDCAQINKFICKGEDPSTCQRLVSTADPNMNKRFSMEENEMENITITVRNVTADDGGTYWCGGEKADKTHSKLFYHRFILTVVQPPVSPDRSPASTPAASFGGSWVVITVIIGPVVLLLLGLHKRFSHSTATRSGAAAEDYVNGEMQEQIQKPDSANTASSIYGTAQFPINPSASLLYSTAVFRKRSNGGGAEAALGLKPGSSTCQNSTVMYM